MTETSTLQEKTVEKKKAAEKKVVEKEPPVSQMEKIPNEEYLRMDRMPHIWCSGCGVGTSVNAFIRAVAQQKLDKKKLCVVSGIGCTGRVAGYLNLDSFHTTHGRAIPFATGLKLANPDLTVVVYSGDGDLTAIGGNHLVHAARRNIDLKVICVNNFIYSMTGGQAAPTTPLGTIATTTPYGFFEASLSLPQFMEACGAVYVARWTTFHVRQLQKAIGECLKKKGFTFIEVLSPCHTLYGRRNNYRTGLEEMKMFREKSKIKNNIDTREAVLLPNEEIIVGKFIDRERPCFLESMIERFRKVLGSDYQDYKGAVE